MKKVLTTSTYSSLFAPGDMLYPPYSTPSKKALQWLTVTSSLEEGALRQIRPDEQRRLIQLWIEKLVRHELGRPLARLEKPKRGLVLKVSISAAVAELLSKALAARSRRKPRKGGKKGGDRRGKQ